MSNTWEDLAESWMLTLRVGGVAESTRRDYQSTLTYFRTWLDVAHPGTGPGEVSRAHITAYLAYLQDTPTKRGVPMAPVTIGNRFRHLQQWFRWLVEDTDIYELSPMHGMRHPHVPKRLVPAIDEDDIKAILRTCGGASFADLRDRAIILLFLDTGLRRAEMAGLEVEDVDMRRQTVTVIGKGDKERAAPFGQITALALDRYRRARATRRGASSVAWWLAERTSTGLTADGIRQMLERRSERAGISSARAHRWRHTMATEWMIHGGNELDLQAIMGWETLQMAGRYTAAAAARRAAAAHTRYGPADRLLGETATRARGRRRQG
jgi:site-specific recombinase XerD